MYRLLKDLAWMWWRETSSWNQYSQSSSNHMNFCMLLVARQLQRNRVNSERKKMGRRLETFSWVTGQCTNTPSGGVDEWERERKIYWQKGRHREGELEKSPTRERPRPDILTSHIHILFGSLYSTFHDSLCFSPQKQPNTAAGVAMNSEKIDIQQ